MYIPVDVPNHAVMASTVQCVIAAAASSGVPPDLLLAIRSVEAGKAGYAVCNKNQTCDYGEAAINTVMFPQITAMGFSAERAVADGCYAMQAKAEIVKQHLMSKSSDDIFTRAARYHSKTPQHNAEYKRKLTPWLNAWACALITNYRLSPSSPFAYHPDALFVVAAKLQDNARAKCWN